MKDLADWLEPFCAGYIACREGLSEDPHEFFRAAREGFDQSGSERARQMVAALSVEGEPVPAADPVRAAAERLLAAHDSYRAEWAKPHPDEGLPGEQRDPDMLQRYLTDEAIAYVDLRAALAQPVEERLTEGEWWERFGEDVGRQVAERQAKEDRESAALSEARTEDQKP